jgi:hypothetical protein
MLKSTLSISLSAALLTCSFGANAVDWQQEFFSPLTNELPPTRGVTVDDQGYVHLQAYNRFADGGPYFLAHQYTIGASGQVPWIWGLSSVDRMSDCGVYAKAGQRLDCFRVNGFGGEETRLEMRSAYGSNIVWQSSLPAEITLLDASIQQQDEALLFGRIDSSGPGGGSELAVLRANSYAPAEVLSVVPACPSSAQTLTTLRTHLPKEPGQPVRVVKACWNSFGTTDLSLDEFDPQSGQWNTRSIWAIPFGASLARAEIGPQGRPYALVEHHAGFRELLSVPAFADQWWPLPFPVQDKIAAFLVGQQGLTVVSVASDPLNSANIELNTPYDVTWFDDQNGWPMITMHRFEGLGEISPKAYALSSEGDVLVAGSPLHAAGQADRLLLARRDRELMPIAELPLSPDETDVGTTYLIGGANNVAVVARTIARDEGFGDPQTGVRVNQYETTAAPYTR